ncbi:class I SAM-dependent methyltransferase [Pedobacter nyackensis]|uniref:Methyltransferase domain-containing protein n=1 Tax=Pedobacter nyackensis TaxID=475255 RepID=A0A1W2EGC5_9SPHI|nr:class I SAM-dependent methyltransferase [Pedobacter nyackensis]SMD08800.1 Methyltransferase domain-containing protein [Pedobacter nyackensis]
MNNSIFNNDQEFDALYPEHIQQLSRKYWTPLDTSLKAAEFLAEPQSRILDIGSGVGKFCLSAAHHYPDAHFYGVEQRQDLFHLAEKAKEKASLSNVHFIHANITQLNFKEFDHFYYFNSFYENLDQSNGIDDTIETSAGLYLYYCQYLFTALEEKPVGTRLVTLQSLEQEIPSSYKLVDTYRDILLKMWIKQS